MRTGIKKFPKRCSHHLISLKISILLFHKKTHSVASKIAHHNCYDVSSITEFTIYVFLILNQILE